MTTQLFLLSLLLCLVLLISRPGHMLIVFFLLLASLSLCVLTSFYQSMSQDVFVLLALKIVSMAVFQVREYVILYLLKYIKYSFFNVTYLKLPTHFYQMQNNVDIVIINQGNLDHKIIQILHLILNQVQLLGDLLYLSQQLALIFVIMLYVIQILFVSLGLRQHKLLNIHHQPCPIYVRPTHQNHDGQVYQRYLYYMSYTIYLYILIRL